MTREEREAEHKNITTAAIPKDEINSDTTAGGCGSDVYTVCAGCLARNDNQIEGYFTVV
jgi:hypothetical protein